jgi:hypothetical protein
MIDFCEFVANEEFCSDELNGTANFTLLVFFELNLVFSVVFLNY